MELNFKMYGEGDPVIILHGLFGSLDNWVSFGKQMGETYMTYLVDQRDHGKSPHTDTFNYEILAEDLRNFMEQHWIHTGHVIGHSMGGKTAMRFALENGDMVDKLIVLDMAPKQYAHRHDTVFEAMKAVDLEALEYRKDAHSTLMEKLNGDTATAAFLLKNIKRDKEDGFSWKMNVDLLHREYANIVEPIPTGEVFEGEVLFIRGSRSSYITDDEIPLILELFPNARVETLEDAGHWVHADQPTKLLEMIKSFLEE